MASAQYCSFQGPEGRAPGLQDGNFGAIGLHRFSPGFHWPESCIFCSGSKSRKASGSWLHNKNCGAPSLMCKDTLHSPHPPPPPHHHHHLWEPEIWCEYTNRKTPFQNLHVFICASAEASLLLEYISLFRGSFMERALV